MGWAARITDQRKITLATIHVTQLVSSFIPPDSPEKVVKAAPEKTAELTLWNQPNRIPGGSSADIGQENHLEGSH